MNLMRTHILERFLFSLPVSLLISALAGAVVVVVSAPPVAAEETKADQSQKRPARRAAKKVGEEEAKKAEEAQEKAEERQAPARFDWTARRSTETMDDRADEKRDEAILKLKRLLPTIKAGPQKAELIFRLSEMYWARSKFKHLVAMQSWDQQLEQWHSKGRNGEQPKLEEIAELDESNLYKRQALKLYEEILEEYPDYPRKDEVLYNLGSSLYEAGKKQEGVKRYWDLIKQFPNSEYSADAWLELGEHFFNSNKLNHAVKAYNKAAETKKARIYSFALYKLAWCDYNLGEYANALDKFRQVVEYAKKQKATSGEFASRDRIQLLEEALSDMVRSYSHLDAVDDAFEYYNTEVGKERAYKYLSRLAKLYNKEGKHALEVRAFKELNTRYPYHPDAPENQTAIMNAYALADKHDMVRKEVRRLVDLYSPNGTWAKKNADNQTVLDKAFDVVEEKLAGLVTEQHRAAQETKLVETYKLARDIYKEYLDKFPATVNSYDFRFFFAEILYELKQFDEAAPQYDLVVAADAKGKFVRQSAYSSILTWEKVAAGIKETVGKKIDDIKQGRQKGDLKELEKIRALTKGQKYEETPLTEPEGMLANACDKFVEVVPDDEEVVKVKFKSARLYYIHSHFEEAADRFGEIIDRWPKDPLARIGAESIVQSFNVREDWSNLNMWSRKFRDDKGLMADKDFAKKIHEFVEGSTFNEIHLVFEPKSSPKEIADYYRGFVKEFPQSKYALVALYNSMINYDKTNLLDASIETASMILKDYKDFTVSAKDIEESKKEGQSLPKPEDIREKSLFLQASFKERLAEFAESAALYEQYAKEFPKGPKRADAVFNAGIFREGLGEYDVAIANFNTYIKDFPTKEDVPQIVWRIGLIYEKKQDHNAVLKQFGTISRYTKNDPARQVCADYKVIQALLALGKAKEANEAYKNILESYGKLNVEDKAKDCPLLAAGAASFVMLEPEYETYLAIPISTVKKEKELAENLIKKLELVDIVQKKYTQVLQLGQGDYGIASLYRIGVIYKHLAQEIFATPCPKKLTEDQCMIYEAALQEKAFPLEEKAIEAYDKALAKAYELGLYNEWLDKATEALRTYEPGRFPPVHEYDLIASESTFEVPELVELPQ